MNGADWEIQVNEKAPRGWEPHMAPRTALLYFTR